MDDEYEKYCLATHGKGTITNNDFVVYELERFAESQKKLIEPFKGLLDWIIDFNELMKHFYNRNKKLKGRRKALERSRRNQQNPMKSKKCKHGRQYRTRRKK